MFFIRRMSFSLYIVRAEKKQHSEFPSFRSGSLKRGRELWAVTPGNFRYISHMNSWSKIVPVFLDYRKISCQKIKQRNQGVVDSSSKVTIIPKKSCFSLNDSSDTEICKKDQMVRPFDHHLFWNSTKGKIPNWILEMKVQSWAKYLEQIRKIQ